MVALVCASAEGKSVPSAGMERERVVGEQREWTCQCNGKGRWIIQPSGVLLSDRQAVYSVHWALRVQLPSSAERL